MLIYKNFYFAYQSHPRSITYGRSNEIQTSTGDARTIKIDLIIAWWAIKSDFNF